MGCGGRAGKAAAVTMRQAVSGATAGRPAFCMAAPSWPEAGIVRRHLFTDIRVMAESFLVRTKNAAGTPVMMGVNPNSIPAVTAIRPSQRTGQGGMSGAPGTVVSGGGKTSGEQPTR